MALKGNRKLDNMRKNTSVDFWLKKEGILQPTLSETSNEDPFSLISEVSPVMPRTPNKLEYLEPDNNFSAESEYLQTEIATAEDPKGASRGNRAVRSITLEVKEENDAECSSYEKIKEPRTRAKIEEIDGSQQCDVTIVGCVKGPINVKDELIEEELQLTDVDDIDSSELDLKTEKGTAVKEELQSTDNASGHPGREAMSEHSLARNYSCFLCKNTFMTRAEMNLHVEVQFRFSSTPCRSSFFNKEKLDDPVFDPTLCNKSFRPPEEFFKHYQEYRCTLCKKRFFTENALMSHSTERKYSCSSCEQICCSVNELKKHNMRRKRHCSQCGKRYCSVNELKEHNIVRKHKCAHCEVRFCEEFALINHNKEIKYSCSSCEQIFCSVNELKKHNMRRKRQCSQWEISFCEEFALNNHKYTCSLCEKRYCSDNELKEHNIGRKHQCAHCEIRFCEEFALINHNKEIKYFCSLCEKRFCSDEMVTKHKHHFCALCEVTFSSEHALIKHSKKGKNLCLFCEKRFCSEKALIKHEKESKSLCIM